MKRYLFAKLDDVRKELSLVDTDDVVVGLLDVLGQVEELGSGDGGQGLLVVSRDRLAVVPDVVRVLHDQARVTRDLKSILKFKELKQKIKLEIDLQ
jgi:hypothetical protein